MASIIREQCKGLYDKIKMDDGQIHHKRIGEVRTTWTIAMCNSKEEIISITKNEEPTRTYAVRDVLGYAIKLRKTYIGSMFGAKGLFDFFSRIDSSCDYKFKYLEKTWDYVKPIKS
jgi:hypothetical protein